MLLWDVLHRPLSHIGLFPNAKQKLDRFSGRLYRIRGSNGASKKPKLMFRPSAIISETRILLNLNPLFTKVYKAFIPDKTIISMETNSSTKEIYFATVSMKISK